MTRLTALVSAESSSELALSASLACEDGVRRPVIAKHAVAGLAERRHLRKAASGNSRVRPQETL
jgi:hypothetical protein